MNLEEKKNELIKARNLMSLVFNNSKDEWGDDWAMKDLCICMGMLDIIINQKLGQAKTKNVGEK